MLRVESVDYSYGPVRALKDVSLTVEKGEVVCLLGANGAGKSTLLSLISGLVRPDRGRVVFDGRQISGMKTSGVVAAGVVQVPEGRQLFAPLTVRENLELGAFLRDERGQRGQVARDMDMVLEMFPVLAERAGQQAGTLSGGEQQMLAIARGLMARPRILLLDEPSLGLAPRLAADIFRTIRELPLRGTAVLLVEQNALGALAVSVRGYIITNGAIRHAGTPDQILEDKLLREAFLGPDRMRNGQHPAAGAGPETGDNP